MSPVDRMSNWFQQHVLQILTLIVVTSIAWAKLNDAVAGKADEKEVQAMAADIRDIKSILCAQTTKDSFCARVNK